MDTADNQTILNEQLISLGAEASELDTIIGDVNKVITENILTEYFDSIDPLTRKHLSSLSRPELNDYVIRNKKLFPPFSEKRCQTIAEETWADYFRFMKEKTVA